MRRVLLAAAAIVSVATVPVEAQPASAARSDAGTAFDSEAADATFDSAAALAWRQFERLWVPATGLARATPDYEKLTPWDIGSVMAALYSARILGLIDEAAYRSRMRTTLRTLERIPLYEGKVFHKIYHARTTRMVGRGGGESRRGYSWSATDLGRFLIWLRIVGQDEPFRATAERVARRMDFSRVVENGYMHGEELSPQRRSGVRRFQEGRVGYEQYSARGFQLWGVDVGPALDLHTNGIPAMVQGVELLADRRGLDRLTSEPFILMGLETGWSPAEARLARNLLEAQERRYRATGTLTIASEDALGVAPHYFYYNCVLCTGRPFVIETAVPGRPLTGPRWVSTKATFGWHVLAPSDYTALALNRIMAGARSRSGWSSGIFEKTGRPTGTHDVNTAAVILEAAAYRKLGRPFLLPNAGSR